MVSLKSPPDSKLTASAVERTGQHDRTVSCPLFWRRMWCGTALARRACRDGLSASGPVELCRVNGFAIRGALRPYVEFISDAWHGEDESWRLRVRLYLAP